MFLPAEVIRRVIPNPQITHGLPITDRHIHGQRAVPGQPKQRVPYEAATTEPDRFRAQPIRHAAAPAAHRGQPHRREVREDQRLAHRPAAQVRLRPIKEVAVAARQGHHPAPLIRLHQEAAAAQAIRPARHRQEDQAIRAVLLLLLRVADLVQVVQAQAQAVQEAAPYVKAEGNC